MKLPANCTEKARASNGEVCLISQVSCVSIAANTGEGTAESDGKRFVVRADVKLTAFLKLEAAI